MLRELTLAIPPHGNDIYRRHQLVWRAMHQHACSGKDFLFVAKSSNVMVIRSDHLHHGNESQLRDGELIVAIVAETRTGIVGKAITDQLLPAWMERMMANHGFRLQDMQASNLYYANGLKMEGERSFAIQLAVRDIRMDVSIIHRGKAQRAWQTGVGRGKRFGYGMLRPAH
jgi:hypothetical protein